MLIVAQFGDRLGFTLTDHLRRALTRPSAVWTVIVCDPGIPVERYQHPGPDAWSGHGGTRRGTIQRGSDQPRSRTHVFIELRQLALWPLRRVGVDPGRAMANARPQPGQLRAWRRAQLACITDRIAAHHDQATAPTRPLRDVPDIWKRV